jgi:antitoxin component YwqK of YwqJK toxin-antitoxin module
MNGDKYEGRSVYYFEAGGIQLECNYKNNVLQGPMIRYWSFNRKKDEQNYDKGNLDGVSTSWFEDGGKASEATYKQGVLDGPFRQYHPENRIRVEGQYLNGFYTGRWLYYDMGGNIIAEADFIHGTGRERSFYPNGNLKHEVRFKDNLKDGDEIIYDDNRKINTINSYHNDSLIGVIKK